ncbi:MAG: circularly permuted type 2 ATP-grasp protein [Pirellulales bacterium]
MPLTWDAGPTAIGPSWPIALKVRRGPATALENRLVTSRVFAEQFHDARVRRHATFFKTLRDSLFSSATRHKENPRVVLLTPGPSSSAYFEDVYLARYLGYTLVEGSDLTVRDNSVFLKTLGGLLPVDVVLRRLPDLECDPLELRSESMLGVAGLLQAARSGNVVIANALGSGILEAPALAAYLPELCRRMLGEDLKLPSVATWWCGREDDRRYVLEHLRELIIKPALLHRSRKPVYGGSLAEAELQRLAARIEKHPHAYAAQAMVERSSTPVWTKGSLQPRHVALRTFVAADGEKYDVMPGGLIRVTADPHVPAVSMSSGQGSKDLWVLSEGPVAQVSLLKPYGAPIELRRSGNDLPSRVADNMFWLGRQLERAEGIVRQWRAVIMRWMSESEPGAVVELPILFDALLQDWPDKKPDGDDDPYRARFRQLLRLLYDETRPDSLRSTIYAAHRLASIMRDRLSIDSYRIISRLRAEISSGGLQSNSLDDVLLQINQLIVLLSAFSGMGMESMTRGPSWRFLDMGRRLERAQHTVRLLHGVLVRQLPEPAPVIESLLEIADSSMTYRSRYLTSIQLAPVLDLILTDESNPRSTAFQLAALSDHVKGLPHDEERPQSTPEQRVMLAAQTELRLTDVEALCQASESDGGEHKQLGELLARLERHLNALSEAIAHTYLVHAGPSRHLGRVTHNPMQQSPLQ